ncbi:MAG: uracil phosphoribosyltransferase, partial [Treponema sp.]|nr:uracil phosphoribosyltransferase [Treponema sp.]
DDTKKENDMQYILNLKNSFFDLEEMNGKDLIFADPMNATGGSLVTVVKYLQSQGVKPRSIKFFNVISALKGSLRVTRALENCTCYTLWMDPVMNEKAYIMPGLGDAGDRLNGRDSQERPRNIIQLIADYGHNITGLYRSQLRKIEQTVLGAL